MRFSTVFTLGLVTATLAPAVMSVPLAGHRSPPLPSNTVQPPSKQTSGGASSELLDNFLSTLSADQLQTFSGIIQSSTPMPTNTTAPAPTTTSTPEKRNVKGFFKNLGNGIKNFFKNIF